MISYNQMKIAADVRRDDLLREAQQENLSRRGWLQMLLHGQARVSEEYETAKSDAQPNALLRLRGVIVPR